MSTKETETKKVRGPAKPLPFIVTDRKSGTPRLVNATCQTDAVEALYSVRRATTEDIMKLAKDVVELEQAG
jgi:hypothetical protein